jgi:hypothetical protein
MEKTIKRSDVFDEKLFNKVTKKYSQIMKMLIVLNAITFGIFEERFNYQAYLATQLMNEMIEESLK